MLYYIIHNTILFLNAILNIYVIIVIKRMNLQIITKYLLLNTNNYSNRRLLFVNKYVFTSIHNYQNEWKKFDNK